MTGATLLIVDDHAGFRARARAVLEASGFVVVGEAASGEDAVIATRDLRPDVVLLDVVLPDVDGFEVCSRLAVQDPLSDRGAHLESRGEQLSTALARLAGARLHLETRPDWRGPGIVARFSMKGQDLLAVASSIGLGTIAAWSAHGPGDDIALLVADGAVGSVLVVAAYVARGRRPKSSVGSLMGLAGLAWFAGSFVPGLGFLHRGPLVHLHLAYPSGRVRWWPAIAAIAAAYLAAVITPVARNDVVALTLAAIVVVVAAGQYLRTYGTARRAGKPALLAALAFAGALALASLNRVADWQSDRTVLWVYYVAIASAVVVLLADLLRARWSDAVVTDFVIELGGQPERDTLRSAIGRALGDPQLVIAYWLPQERQYVDDAGRRIDLSNPGPGRVLTPLGDGETPVGALVHDAAVLDDPPLVAAVVEGARLAVSNAALQAATRERVDLLIASRRRIIDAADAQRSRLQRELRDRVQKRLNDVAESIAGLAELGDLRAGVIADLVCELEGTNADLEDFARGLHPRSLVDAGLGPAISQLATRLAIDLDLSVPSRELPAPTAAMVYFVCAEALTNVVKHAGARRVTVDVVTDGVVTTITVADDGSGGADPARGSGLEGLRDRVQAFGGTLTIHSHRGEGTRLHAIVPSEAGSD